MCYHVCMVKRLSYKDQKIYSFITRYILKNGQAPTLNEIKNHFGYASLTSVQRSLNALDNNGLINREKYKERGISLATEVSETVNIPLVGGISCGSPSISFQNFDSYIPTDKKLLKKNKEHYFYIYADGDSMNKAGIKNGDLVLVRKAQTAEDGDRVITFIDGSVTIKLFNKKDNCVVLQPKSTNKKHKPIILRDNFKIQGVVERVIRQE